VVARRVLLLPRLGLPQPRARVERAHGARQKDRLLDEVAAALGRYFVVGADEAIDVPEKKRSARVGPVLPVSPGTILKS
jgi:hypothetical protein